MDGIQKTRPKPELFAQHTFYDTFSDAVQFEWNSLYKKTVHLGRVDEISE